MAQMTVVKAALAAQIQSFALPKITCLPKIPDQITPPCAIIVPARNYGKFGITMGPAGGPQLMVTEVNLDCLVIISRASTIDRVQDSLDRWLGMEDDAGVVSIPAAVEEDDTLAGAVDFCKALSVDAPGPVDWNGVMYFGSRIHFSLSL